MKSVSKNVDYHYEVKLDINQDAWNWYVGCNKQSYGVDWKQRVPEEVYKHVFNVEKEVAHEFLMGYLNNKYVEDEAEIRQYETYVNKEYEQKFTSACEKLVEVVGKPLYRNDFTTYLTTFPRGPYDYETGSHLMAIGWKDPVKNFLHELLHFQLIHYWVKQAPTSAIARLGRDEFDWLKESLTVILDEDFYPLISTPDKGYELHREYREELHSFWQAEKNFDELVEFGLEKLPGYFKIV